MIVRFESANPAPARIVEVYTDEDCVLLRILDCHTVVQFDKHIRVPGHHRFQLRFAQLAVKTLGDIESNNLFWWAIPAICAAILAPMSGIHYHRIKSLSRVLDRSSRDSATSS